MASNSDIEIHIHQQMIISKLMEENNRLKKNQLKEIKDKEEEKKSLQFDFQLLKRELHELILKNNKEERAKREEENNLQKSQMETLIKEIIEREKREEENNLQKSQMEALKKEIEELKNGLLLLTEVNKEKEDEGLICKGNTEDIWDATEKGFLPAVKFYFRENPENIHKGNKNDNNYTPLHYTSCYGHLDIVKFLISKKVNIDAISSFSGSTPLMLASLNGHLSIMELLLDCGAKINHQDKDKSTSLHYAVNRDHLDCVKLLINKGADKTLKNNQNETPLAMAKRLNQTSIVEYLSSL